MKYVVLLCDGMADEPVEALSGGTPMSAANKPAMDHLSSLSEIGLVKTVAEGLKPGSDVANLSVLGYDPAVYYTGRSPLEAASIGIDLKETDVTLRCNLVTLSEEPNYEDKTLVDYCSDDISSEEARVLIEEIDRQLGNETFRFYPGVSYRHCLVWANGVPNPGELTPPHDITGRKITSYIPKGAYVDVLYGMMRKSYEILKNHPVNLSRIERGKRPANSIWLWGEGQKPRLDSFEKKFGLKGAVISAVDLIKGIGKCAKMRVCEVEGATGYIDTNFSGKMQAAVEALKTDCDFVYIHVEAPDECGHRNELENKIRSIELIDSEILAPLLENLKELSAYSVMILPDHPTPLSIRTHSSAPVPYLIYRSWEEKNSNVTCFSEQTAKNTGIFCREGHTLLEHFLEK